MEVYVLDSLLRRIEVFDVFESLIWTERFSEIGDFELSIKSTLETRTWFTTGTKIAINESYRVMTVETVEDTTDADGKSILKVKGNSLENILKDRPIRRSTASDAINTFGDTSDWNPSFHLPPVEIARALFDDVCRWGYLSPSDIIPFLSSDPIFPPDTFPEPEDAINWPESPDQLYNVIKKICDLYDLGFRLCRNFDMSQLKFDVYTGNDRTTRQTDLPPVIFSVGLDNLQNTTEFSTTDQSKNVAYVFSDLAILEVYGTGVDPDVEGFERRVILVDATGDVDETTVDVEAVLTQRGQEELASNRAMSYFDGELNQTSEYKYGVDYQVGDLVELRNVDGVVTYKRVTEQIFVSDSQGDRSYPTLTLDLYIGMVTWLSYGNKSIVWLDYDLLPDTWSDM